jgi:alkanesulfonate monooxygenase SsuD/methylene tetrahydromethanopterin reductase-like flavin-dependent oxidoreductase (luciferase family)
VFQYILGDLLLLFGLNIDKFEPSEAVRYAVLLEKHGFDSVWLADHLIDLGGGGKVDPWTVGAAIAVNTSRLLICSAVTDTQRCHPAKTAHIVANLDALSKGRTVLGIGAGEAMNIIPFGIDWEKPFKRAKRLREAIQVIKTLWASDVKNPAYYKGEYFNLSGAFLDQLPFKNTFPPIYLGAFSSEYLLRTAGELCEGWMGWINPPEIFKKRADKIKEFARLYGRHEEDIHLATMLHVGLSDDNRLQRKAIQKGKTSLLKERTVLKQFGYKAPSFPHYQNLIVSKNIEVNLKQLSEEISDEAVYRSMVIGGEDECVERIFSLMKVGASHIGISDLLSPRYTKTTIEKFENIIEVVKADNT